VGALGLGNPSHLAVIALVVLLLFGTRRLPDIGRSLGTGLRQFKQSLTEVKEITTLPTTADAHVDASTSLSTSPRPAED
jgi:sec-independent protein translocase protein TatA